MSADPAAITRAVAWMLEDGRQPAPIEAELVGRMVAAFALAHGGDQFGAARRYVDDVLAACERGLAEVDGHCGACGGPVPRGVDRCAACRPG